MSFDVTSSMTLTVPASVPLARRQARAVRARYDSAQTTPENRRHWANADALSADAAASPLVRATLRNRCRYEYDNNGYVKGMCRTHANFVVGTGPRLHMQTTDAGANALVKKEFRRWARKIRLGKKLRTLVTSRLVSGESLALFVTNPKLKTKVKLDLKLIECDRVRAPLNQPLPTPTFVDGIEYDADGNPIVYHVMRLHPGGNTQFSGDAWKSDPWPAEKVVHLYDWDRPEQSRGVPQISPSLPLFAQLRRFTLAVVAAAETAADHAAVMQTSAPPDGAAAEVDAGTTMELEPRQMVALPEGWTLAQMKAEQPTSTYAAFKDEILNESGRPLNMPSNIGKCDSSKYNYSSGRLDHQTYFRSIEIEQDDLEIELLDRVFEEWLAEAVLIEGYLPQAARVSEELEHVWFWDGLGHIDPVKDATAQSVKLQSGCTTLRDEYAAEGKDWEEQLEQRGKEIARMKALGIPLELPQGNKTQPQEDLANEK